MKELTNEELTVTFASNLVRLRQHAGMKQSDLAAKLNYSDKSISKWERAEALPDVIVIKKIADIFSVSVDFLLTSHDEWSAPKINKANKEFNTWMIIGVAMFGIITFTCLLFVIFWMRGKLYWEILLASIPVALITLLVLNTLWNDQKNNVYIVMALVFGIFILMYYLLRQYTPWQLIFVLIPSEIVVYLSFQIKKIMH